MCTYNGCDDECTSNTKEMRCIYVLDDEETMQDDEVEMMTQTIK